MMTEEQRSRASELAAAIGTTVTTGAGTPPEVRDEAVALKREVRRDGTTARELAAVLGVHESTLCRWERDALASRGPATMSGGRSAGFRMVQLAAPAVTPTMGAPASTSTVRGLRVAHAPSGLVVDGLDVESLAVLLRRLS